MLKKFFHGLFQLRKRKTRFPASFIFNGLQPSKMMAHPCATHRLSKNGVFQQPAKAGSKKQRPLGIPALEGKLVQAGLVKIMQAVYEQGFISGSYGFRPKRGCHDALRALSESVERHPVNHIVEADIKGFPRPTLKHDPRG